MIKANSSQKESAQTITKRIESFERTVVGRFTVLEKTISAYESRFEAIRIRLEALKAENKANKDYSTYIKERAEAAESAIARVERESRVRFDALEQVSAFYKASVLESSAKYESLRAAHKLLHDYANCIYSRVDAVEKEISAVSYETQGLIASSVSSSGILSRLTFLEQSEKAVKGTLEAFASGFNSHFHPSKYPNNQLSIQLLQRVGDSLGEAVIHDIVEESILGAKDEQLSCECFDTELSRAKAHIDELDKIAQSLHLTAARVRQQISEVESANSFYESKTEAELSLIDLQELNSSLLSTIHQTAPTISVIKRTNFALTETAERVENSPLHRAIKNIVTENIPPSEQNKPTSAH